MSRTNTKSADNELMDAVGKLASVAAERHAGVAVAYVAGDRKGYLRVRHDGDLDNDAPFDRRMGEVVDDLGRLSVRPWPSARDGKDTADGSRPSAGAGLSGPVGECVAALVAACREADMPVAVLLVGADSASAQIAAWPEAGREDVGEAAAALDRAMAAMAHFREPDRAVGRRRL
jgi:hypothetical protein